MTKEADAKYLAEEHGVARVETGATAGRYCDKDGDPVTGMFVTGHLERESKNNWADQVVFLIDGWEVSEKLFTTHLRDREVAAREQTSDAHLDAINEGRAAIAAATQQHATTLPPSATPSEPPPQSAPHGAPMRVAAGRRGLPSAVERARAQGQRQG